MKRKQKYGIDMRFIPKDVWASLTSIEAYVGSGGISPTKSAMSFDELVALVVEIYEIPGFVWNDKFKAIIDLHHAIKSLPRAKRQELQAIARSSAGVSRKDVGVPVKIALQESHDRFVPTRKDREQFYKSWDWQTLRNAALKKYGRCCQSCGAKPGMKTIGGDSVRIVVDHIESIATHWHRRLDSSNLQILCDECNMGKGAWDSTDHRPR